MYDGPIRMTWPQYLRNQCKLGDRLIKLLPRESKILSTLLLRFPRPTDMNTLIESVYENPDTEPELAHSVVYGTICKLRRKLGYGAILRIRRDAYILSVDYHPKDFSHSTAIQMTWTQYKNHECSVSGFLVKLSSHEAEILSTLLVRYPSPVDNKTLLESIWQNPDEEPENSVDVVFDVIRRLKNKIGGYRILQENSRGYVLVQTPLEQ